MPYPDPPSYGDPVGCHFSQTSSALRISRGRGCATFFSVSSTGQLELTRATLPLGIFTAHRDHADHAPAGISYRSSQDYHRSHPHSCLDLNYTSGLFHVAILSPHPEDLVILDLFHRCPVIRMRNLWSWTGVPCLTEAIWSYLL